MAGRSPAFYRAVVAAVTTAGRWAHGDWGRGTHLPVVTTGAPLRALGRRGFRRVRQRGSHVVMQRKDRWGTGRAVVPVHSGDVKRKTLRSILRQAGMTVQELLEACVGYGRARDSRARPSFRAGRCLLRGVAPLALRMRFVWRSGRRRRAPDMANLGGDSWSPASW